MALTSTTLTAAITAQDTYFAVGATTGITAPVSTTGSGYTWLLVESEIMFVTGVNTTTLVVNVLRGQLGTQAVAHGASAPVAAGAYSDFPGFSPAISGFSVASNKNIGFSAPVVSAATITATGPRFHLTGTTQVTTMKPYSGYIEGGPIVIVFDGSGSGLTWSTGGTSPYAFSVAGTATTAASAVEFIYDASIPGWIPLRLA